ncbi:hypothetical protein D4764_11G0009690 [Takifugu flavidus]|uniref:Uncharacterized protein n=1 Tax=Takifugu flavidus TaxID=433684 RepID=A0A5C6PJG2_9TELE|nr:hypothetical protein D4764_11G0009690 [Takifugu flavidus]
MGMVALPTAPERMHTYLNPTLSDWQPWIVEEEAFVTVGGLLRSL